MPYMIAVSLEMSDEPNKTPDAGNITCISMKNGKKRLSLRAKYRVLCMVNGKTAGGQALFCRIIRG